VKFTKELVRQALAKKSFLSNDPAWLGSPASLNVATIPKE